MGSSTEIGLWARIPFGTIQCRLPFFCLRVFSAYTDQTKFRNLLIYFIPRNVMIDSLVSKIPMSHATIRITLWCLTIVYIALSVQPIAITTITLPLLIQCSDLVPATSEPS